MTFAPMVSSRGIPARLIALLGMSSNLFTLKDRVVPYDPLMVNPRAGDHSRREDDQGIFLEALLACRNSIFISYSGTGQEAPGEIIPSAPLAYLIDSIRTMSPDWENPVMTRTLLEGFSPQRPIVKHPDFPSVPLPDDMNEAIPAEFPDQIEIDDLRSFIRDPSRFFWSFCSGGALRNTIFSLPSSDPFVLGFMESRVLGKKIFSYLDDKNGEIPSMDLVTPLGLLPHGSGSRTIFESLSGAISRLWREKNLFLLQNQGTHSPLLEVPIFRIPGILGETFRLEGKVEGQVFAGDSHVNHAVFLPYFHSGKDILSLWIDHLLLSVCFEEKTVVSRIYSLSGSGRESYSLKGDGKRLLHDIFSLFCHGSLLPVPIFLKSAWAYADCYLKFRKKASGANSPNLLWGDINGADRRNALEKAEKVWISERKNPDISPEEVLLHANNPPWSRKSAGASSGLIAAEKISLRVFVPILDAAVDEKKGNAA